VPYNNINELVGKTIVYIECSEDEAELYITIDDGTKYKMYHRQDCCEFVYVEDVCGDVCDLLNSPIIEAEEVTSGTNPDGVTVPEYQDSFTWTFYKFRTAKGSVTIRWYGESNGYYSESVDFIKL
jgi:hypothetical protein